MTMNTPDPLATVKAALEAHGKATPGPLTLDPTDDDLIAADDAVRHSDGSTGNVVGYLYTAQDTAAAVAWWGAAPAIAALVDEVERLRATVEERECDMHTRIRAGYDKTIADTWRAALAKSEAHLATAKRLGLEACDLASSGAELIDNGGIDDDNECPRVKRDLRRLRAALEALP